MSKPVLPETDARVLGRVIKEQGQTTRGTPQSVSYYGPRSDLPSGYGVRVRIGLLSDLTYGVERFDSTGVRSVPTWV